MKLAIFDFDGTLFPKDTLPFLLKQWYKQNYSKIKLLGVVFPLIPTYLKYKMVKNTSSDTINKMRLKAVLGFNQLLAGMTEEEIKRFFSLSSAAIKSQLNPAVVAKAKKARREGYHTVLLSGAYLLLLNYIKDFLDFDTVIGSEIYFDQGIFYNNKTFNIVTGSSKVDKLKTYFKNEDIDWQASLAFADSMIDLQVLELVGNPTAVCPDPKLLDIALERKWEIIK
ncbi:MAG: hypothetical protein JM58_05090 [Peptococcaceae bacterium BICA1-8]|nr:MAG: hypothetical protein JM58_05090 [Peptococcaceae bacterium BICA1-8]